MKERTIQDYEDIIDLPHPDSTRHPRMTLYDRAAQFSSFSALNGHEEAIEETARLTDHRVELDEDTKAKLDEKLWRVAAGPDRGAQVRITYFVADDRKAGGVYVTITGIIKKIDTYDRVIVMTDGVVVPMDEIVELEIESDLQKGE